MSSLSSMSREQLLLIFKNYNDCEVAKQFGVTRQSVYYIRKKFNIPSSRQHIQSRNKKVLELYKKDVKCCKIASIVGISLSYVYKIIKDNNGGRKNSSEQNITGP